jgi:hypothetical protein
MLPLVTHSEGQTNDLANQFAVGFPVGTRSMKSSALETKAGFEEYAAVATGLWAEEPTGERL